MNYQPITEQQLAVNLLSQINVGNLFNYLLWKKKQYVPLELEVYEIQMEKGYAGSTEGLGGSDGAW